MAKDTEFMACDNCRKKVLRKRRTQRFCSDKCRIEKWLETHPRVSIEVPK